MLAFIASALLFTQLPIAVFHLVNVGTIPLNIISKYQNPELSQDVFTSISTLPLMLADGALVLLSFIPVFLYKNRPLQYRLCLIGFLVNTILIIIIFFTADSMQSQLKTEAQYKLGAILPLISLVLLILASKAIRKDEKKVKAADRLR